MAPTRKRVSSSFPAATGILCLLAACSPGGTGGAGPAGKDGPERAASQAVPAPALRFHFEPAHRDFTDVAVGETVTTRVVLVADAPGPDGAVDWSDVLLASSCDCLTADFVGQPKGARADVLVTVFGLQVEDATAANIMVQNSRREEIGKELEAPVSVRRKPFVQPREVQAEGKEGRFELIVGQAFAPDAELPAGVLDDIGAFDETKLALLDMPDQPPERTEKDAIVRMKLVFCVVEDARAAKFETEIPLTFGVPPVKRTVKVRWPATH